jgi:hypothetical protein
VGLHVLDELYALFSPEAPVHDPSTEDSDQQTSEETCCCLLATSAVTSGIQTLQFHGQFRHQPIVILLDSGSSTSFVSEQLLSWLSIEAVQCPLLIVRVANGELMQCVVFLPDAMWTIHQYQFTHDLKVLPLTSYDLILGMDWLQRFSPMKVDWVHHWLVIPYKGSTVRLQGTPSTGFTDDDELLVKLFSATVEPSNTASQLSPAISTLLSEFSTMISPPDKLPPKRDCDHEIPLVTGAHPITVRPYRYPPALKDKIEA